MAGIDWEWLARERPERIEEAEVLDTPAGGLAGFDVHFTARQAPLSVTHMGAKPALVYFRWAADGEVAYWRSDVWRERFGEAVA